MKLIESVPNISEGRDRKVIQEIVGAVAAPGVQVLHVDSEHSTNRSVITIAGVPDAVCEGLFRLIQRSVELIDMRKHQGAHPRIGAADVVPIIPIRNVSMRECVEFAQALGARVQRELNLPVYLYEHAAKISGRRNLSKIRQGEFEGLANKIRLPEWHPDFGSAVAHPTAGACIIGARDFLIAYNIDLETTDLILAKEIAYLLRESGPTPNYKFQIAKGIHPHLLRNCKAIGWYLPSLQHTQVSFNLTNFNVTGLDTVYRCCQELATRCGTKVLGSELVGVIPLQALLNCGQAINNESSESRQLLEREQLELAVNYLGLGSLRPFDIKSRVLEYLIPGG